MKKMTFLFVVVAALAVTACGSGSTTPEGSDSTVDSTVVKVDSTLTDSVEAVKISLDK